MEGDSIYLGRMKKLEQVIEKLHKGQFVQITALMPVRRMLNNEQTPLYLQYLIERSLFHIRNGNSLSVVDVPEKQEKEEWYGRLLSTLRARNQFGDARFRDEIEKVIAYCETCFNGGWARIWIHATRPMLDDVDICLLWWISRLFLDDWFHTSSAYDASRFYCTSYQNYRFILTERSCPRIMDIVNYLTQERSRRNELGETREEPND